MASADTRIDPGDCPLSTSEGTAEKTRSDPGQVNAMTRIILAVLLIGVATPAAARQGATPLAAARDLYASARYDEALAMLDTLRSGDSGQRTAVEQYRSLCLLALGRSDEAEGAIAAVVTADPMFQPSETDASPRVRAAFTEVRQKLLPQIATSRYTLAKATFDRGDYPEAARLFRQVQELLDDRDMGGRLPDLRMLVEGFVSLSERAAAPPAPEPEPAPAPEPAPRAEPPAERPEAEPVANRIYTAADRGVTQPTIVKQDMPSVPAVITAQARNTGVLELVIDEKGRVISMKFQSSVHPIYDGQVLGAARDWRYRPATLNGQPVKFRKLIQITVRR
jgi:TonB family protein